MAAAVILPELSARERDALRMVAAGVCDKAAAHRLGVSPGHYRNIVSSAVRRIGAESRAHAAVLAERAGMLG